MRKTFQEEPAAEGRLGIISISSKISLEKPSESGDAQAAAEEQRVVADIAEAAAVSAVEDPTPSGEEAAQFAASSKFSFICSYLENLLVKTIVCSQIIIKP